MQDRADHLAWAKQRAHEYVDRGKLMLAVTSLTSDLRKHRDFRGPAYDCRYIVGQLVEVPAGPEAVRQWIDGFN